MGAAAPRQLGAARVGLKGGAADLVRVRVRVRVSPRRGRLDG